MIKSIEILATDRMSSAEFEAWRTRLGLNQTDAAKALHVTRLTVRRWSRRGAPAVIRLACETLEARARP